jgi:O-antigen/teichoic acid export membrane protein
MKREFLINLAFLVLINLIIKPIYIFGIDRTIQNTVGDIYGIYFALLSFSYLFQMVNDMGLQNFTSRHISMKPHLIDRYFSGTLQLKALLGIVYAIIVLVFAVSMGYEAAYFRMLIWIIIIQFLTSMQMWIRANIAGLGLYRLDSLLSVFDKSLLILILGYVFLDPSLSQLFELEWFLYAQTASLTIAILAGFGILLPRIKKAFRPVRLSFMLQIVRQSYPYALIFILMIIYTRIDAVMLERMLPNGVSEAAIYASAYRLLDAASMFSYLFIALLLPMFSRLIATSGEIGSLFRVSLKLMTASTVSLSIPIFFFSGEIMRFLYVFGDEYSGEILGVLMLGYICISLAHIFGALILAGGSVRNLNKLFFGAIVLNFVLNLILIQHMQGLGAAISTLITEGFIMVSMGIMIARQFEGAWSIKIILRALIFILGSILMVYIFKTYFNISPAMGFSVSVIGCGFLAIVLGMLPLSGIRQIILMKQTVDKT